MKKIKLDSTHTALIGRYVMNITWILVLGIFMSFMKEDFDEGFKETVELPCEREVRADPDSRVLYLMECSRRSPETLSEYWNADVPDLEEFPTFLSFMGMFISGIFIFGNFCGMVGNLYRAKSMYFIDKEEGVLRVKRFSFPNQVQESYYKFERVLEAKVTKGIFDGFFDTGSLSLRLAAFTNADAKEVEVRISWVDCPGCVRDSLLQGLPGHEGLDVNLKFPSEEK